MHDVEYEVHPEGRDEKVDERLAKQIGGDEEQRQGKDSGRQQPPPERASPVMNGHSHISLSVTLASWCNRSTDRGGLACYRAGAHRNFMNQCARGGMTAADYHDSRVPRMNLHIRGSAVAGLGHVDARILSAAMPSEGHEGCQESNA